MVGVILIIAALVVFPIVFLMSMAAVAAALGALLKHDGDVRHEGSELLDVNV